MDQHLFTGLLFASDSDPVPTEIELFAAGVTDTRKGKFTFDKGAAEAVMAAFLDSGVDRLPFDAGHSMLNPASPPEGHRALGWFVPAVSENGALMATDIQWTDKGRAALEAREFRFFSPAIKFNSSRQITELINVALTNIPATKNQKPLVLDGAETTNPQEKEPAKMQVLLDKLGAADESGAVAKLDAMEAQLGAVQEELSKAQAELTAVEAKRAAEAKAARVAELSAAGVLPPSQKAFAESLDMEQLEQFAATLSASVVTAPKIEEAAEATEKLSAVELKICEQLGVSESDFIETKKAQEAKKAGV